MIDHPAPPGILITRIVWDGWFYGWTVHWEAVSGNPSGVICLASARGILKGLDSWLHYFRTGEAR
jgi:hypothetical protein